MVPCSLVLAVLGPKLAEVFLGTARRLGRRPVHRRGVRRLLPGLLPYMIFQLQLRVFYSLHDSKTPALIGLVTMAVNIAANLVALSVLRPRDVVAGLGVGFGLANVVGMMHRVADPDPAAARSGRLPDRPVAGPHARRHLAGRAARRLWCGIVTGNALVDVVIGGGLAAAMYLLFARALRIEEMASLSRTVLSRLGR